MFLVVLTVAAAWALLSVLVLGCCVSAAEGDSAGWRSTSRAIGEARILQDRRMRFGAARRSRHAA